MKKQNQEGVEMLNVRLKLEGGERADQICSMLRGLFRSNGQSGGQGTKNGQFRQGITVQFGAAPMARLFVEDAKALLSKPVLARLTIELTN